MQNEKMVRSGIRTHAYMSRLRPERSSALSFSPHPLSPSFTLSPLDVLVTGVVQIAPSQSVKKTILVSIMGRAPITRRIPPSSCAPAICLTLGTLASTPLKVSVQREREREGERRERREREGRGRKKIRYGKYMLRER